MFSLVSVILFTGGGLPLPSMYHWSHDQEGDLPSGGESLPSGGESLPSGGSGSAFWGRVCLLRGVCLLGGSLPPESAL